eukprot:3427530-Amphidinium_carterae.1
MGTLGLGRGVNRSSVSDDSVKVCLLRLASKRSRNDKRKSSHMLANPTNYLTTVLRLALAQYIRMSTPGDPINQVVC